MTLTPWASRQGAHPAAAAHVPSASQSAAQIHVARSIVKDAAALVQHALTLAERCTDRRLSADLRALCERIPTIGVQLRIVSSVKAMSAGAAGGTSSVDADAMLVQNARNLVDAVEQTLRAAESASLRCST